MRTAFLFLLLISAVSVLAQDTCPLGLSNDPHPGQCTGYRDLNSDSLCDLSQNGVEGRGGPATTVLPRVNYRFWEIIIATGILGLATELFIKRNRNKDLHIQIVWNWVLLVSFMASALSGLYYVLPPDKRPAMGFNMSYWHTVTGIVFIAVGLYHTIRRFTCMLGKKASCPNNGNCKGTKKQPE
jgi:hypothetical protein